MGTSSSPPWYRTRWGGVLMGYGIVTVILLLVFAFLFHGRQSSGNAAVTISDPAALFHDDDPSIGASDAVLTVVEFGDFECPYCKRMFPTIREMTTRYGDRMRLIFRDFPVSEIHENALAAAEAGQCALAQGRFWEYHDRLYQNAPILDGAALQRYAEEVGLDGKQFATCLATHAGAAAVQRDLADASALAVRGTPTWFFILRDDRAHAQRVEGVIPRDALASFIESHL